jgi:hypothetical protein
VARGSRNSPDRRARLEAALQQLDSGLRSFSRQHGIVLSVGTGVMPERNLDWRHERLKLRLQILVDNPMLVSFDIWGMAWAKAPEGQLFQRKVVAQSLMGITLKSNTHAFLERGRAMLESWTIDDLAGGV